MIAELGQIALILSLLLAICLSTLPLIGAARGDSALMALRRPLATGLLAFITLAFGLLAIAFLVQDLSIEYVARNSNELLPMHYRFSAVWGAHEGSLLLWCLILGLWTAAVAWLGTNLEPAYASRVLAALGVIAVGFLLFIVFTSNPFARLLPAADSGADLNPLLQDPGLVIHPPMLYMGYVGFAVPFAFALAALMEGRLTRDWIRWARPWTLTAWALLTAGIALGSWWAYYELGWGGWWFWDPVENASFMPWLAGTALIHSMAVTDKRRAFVNWTLLLAIIAFSLSLLGTFLVRSGVLTSVHAFATDPTRGIFILAFLGVVTGGSLVLYAMRAPSIAAGTPLAGYSREVLLLINNVLFATATAMVLVGTVYPILASAMDWGKLSIGAPWFGLMFVLLMAPVVLLIPFGPMTGWQRDNPRNTLDALLPALGLSLVLGLLAAWLLGGSGVRYYLGVIGGIWLLLGSAAYVWRHASRVRRFRVREWGMLLAHCGVGIFVIGVTVLQATETERDVRMDPGDTVAMSGYEFRFEGSRTVAGPNYEAERGTIVVNRGDREIARLQPEKRRYSVSGQVMTEAAIEPGLTRDLYVAMGEPLDQGAWSLRVYVKPYVRWIWGGALLILAGGLLAATDHRYRRAAATAQDAPQAPATGAPA